MHSALNSNISISSQTVKRLYKDICKVIVKPHIRIGNSESGISFCAKQETLFICIKPTFYNIQLTVDNNTIWKQFEWSYDSDNI